MERIIFSITDVCNLNCKHCYEKKRKDTEKVKVDILKIADWINHISPNKVGISGGEPFVERDKLYKFINSLRDDFDINIASNGTLLTNEDMLYLKSRNINLQLSIDGNQEIHDYIRGKGSYKKLLKSIVKLQKYGIAPKLIYTINNINYRVIESAFKLCKEFKMQCLYFERYIPSNHAEELSLDKNIIKEIYNSILEFSKLYQIKVHVNDPLFLVHQIELISNSSKYIVPLIEKMNLNVGCSMCKTSVYVDSYGDIYPCSFIDFSFGNIANINIDDIENNFKKLILQNMSEKSNCVICKYNNICGGCKAVPYNMSGNWKGDNELCWISTEKD